MCAECLRVDYQIGYVHPRGSWLLDVPVRASAITSLKPPRLGKVGEGKGGGGRACRRSAGTSSRLLRCDIKKSSPASPSFETKLFSLSAHLLLVCCLRHAASNLRHSAFYPVVVNRFSPSTILCEVWKGSGAVIVIQHM